MVSRGRGAHAAPYTSAAELEARRAEREELRGLTRELHEAAKDARDARRELRAAMAEIMQVLETTAAEHRQSFTAQLNDQAAAFGTQWLAALTGAMEETAGKAAANMNAALKEAEDRVGRDYGWQSFEDLRDAIVLAVIRRLAPYSSDAPFEEEAMANLRGLRPRRLPDVIVTTPDMVDQVRAADPGRVIIDGTLRALPARGCP